LLIKRISNIIALAIANNVSEEKSYERIS